MDYIKLQTDLMKAYQKGGVNAYRYWQNDDYTYLILDGCAVFAIPNECWLIQLNKVFSEDLKAAGIESILSNIGYTKTAEFTGTQKARIDRKNILAEIQTEEEESIWINHKYATMFGKEYILEATNSNAPVYFYDNNQFLGFVLPVRKIN